jgi:hypothetical protein
MAVRTGTVVAGALLLAAGLFVGLAFRGVGSGSALIVAGLVLVWWGFIGPWLDRFAGEQDAGDGS